MAAARGDTTTASGGTAVVARLDRASAEHAVAIATSITAFSPTGSRDILLGAAAKGEWPTIIALARRRCYWEGQPLARAPGAPPARVAADEVAKEFHALITSVKYTALGLRDAIDTPRALFSDKWMQASYTGTSSQDHHAAQGGGGASERSSVTAVATQDERSDESNADNAGTILFDPRVLVFEFLTTFMVREMQIELVEDFLKTVGAKQSAVVQMIMGGGKTSVVSPLLAMMLADGKRLISLVVPEPLLPQSMNEIQEKFNKVIMKRVSCHAMQFQCNAMK